MTVYINRRVPLANGRGTVLVHAIDYERVMQYKWYLHPAEHTDYAQRFYTTADGKQTSQYMHELITGRKHADHRNRQGLDNRRSNLRVGASKSQQAANRGKRADNASGYIGVSWNKQHSKWSAEVHKDSRRVWSAYFDDLEEAARARDAKVLEHHGEFAVLNFPR